MFLYSCKWVSSFASRVSKVGYEGSMVRVFGRFPAAMRLVALNP